MAPMSKEGDLLTAPPQSAVATPSATPFGVGTETTNRPLPVALEVPVTVNGARTVEGSDKREPFSETTKTVLVFGNGAVIRLISPVAPGQLLFLTNEKTKKEVVCQVVKSKNYKNVSGYVELEFTESVVGFWGMRFPTDRIGTPAPAPAPVATIPSPVKATPSAPVSLAPKLPEAKLPEVRPAQIQAEMKPLPPPRPVEVQTAVPAAPVPIPPAVHVSVPPVVPVAKKPEPHEIPASPSSPSLAASLASLLKVPEPQPFLTPSKPPAAPVTLSTPTENKPEPAKLAADNSSEELKLQAARLQEQLSSLLFSAAPTAKPVTPSPVVPALDAKIVSNVAASVLEIAKSEPAPVKPIPAAKAPAPPVKSTLDTEQVKIPSWLEPLARNAAAHASPQESAEREKAKHTAEIASREERPAELLPVATEEGIPESQLPAFGSLLPFDEEASTNKRESGGSRKGVLIGAVAAGVLLAAGGGWYLSRPTSAVQGTTQHVASAAIPQTTASSPATQTALQTTAATPVTTPNSGPATPAFSTPTSGAPFIRPPANSAPAPVTRDNTRGAATTIPAAVTERIPQPAAEPEPEPKKPVLGEVHLASPTMNRPSSTQDDGVAAPSISGDNGDANPAVLGSALTSGGLKQPAAPEVPLPTGGDVKAAVLVSKVAPVYPTLAKNQHIAGNVVIDALIDANGRVSTTKVLSGPALLHQAAMDALKQWKYQPATLDGKPVSMHLTVTVQFRTQ